MFLYSALFLIPIAFFTYFLFAATANQSWNEVNRTHTRRLRHTHGNSGSRQQQQQQQHQCQWQITTILEIPSHWLKIDEKQDNLFIRLHLHYQCEVKRLHFKNDWITNKMLNFYIFHWDNQSLLIFNHKNVCFPPFFGTTF